MIKKLLLLFTIFIVGGCCIAETTNAYDQYGSKTGSFKTNGSTINRMTKAEAKQVHIKKLQAGIIHTINMVQKQEVIERHLQVTILMINTEQKQEVLKQIQTA